MATDIFTQSHGQQSRSKGLGVQRIRRQAAEKREQGVLRVVHLLVR